jgi:WD40 repeat protein
MRPRDLLIVAAVLLVAGFAAADALRGLGGSSSAVPPTAPTGTASGESVNAPPVRRIRGFTVGRLPGRIVFTGETCVIQELDLPTGTIFPLPRLAGTCKLWSPRNSERLAYSLRSALRSVVPFRIVDLNHAYLDLGQFQARIDSLVWRPDGQRVAWCDARGEGRELEVGETVPAELPGCPAGYTEVGNLVYVQGREVRVGGRVLLRARGGIDALSFGDDGSVALAVDGRAIQVYRRKAGQLSSAAEFGLAPPLQGRVPVFSPDNCGAFFRTPNADRVERITVVDLGCLPRGGEQSFPGHAAAWSPDGRWIAVAARDAILFHAVDGGSDTIRFTTAATDLAWKG